MVRALARDAGHLEGHELAHQWLGDTEELDADAWLVEPSVRRALDDVEVLLNA